MEQDDEEFEKLLGEIPRATSAPPHLEEIQRDPGSRSEDGSFLFVKDETVKSVSDIRYDELYEDLFRSYSGLKKLSQAMENRAVHNDLAVASPNSPSNQLSSFYSGMALESPRSSFCQRQLELHQKQHQSFLQSQQQQLSPDSGVLDHQSPGSRHLSGSQTHHVLCDDQSLSSAFINLNFEDTSTLKTSAQACLENGTNHGGSSNGIVGSLPNGCAHVVSSGVYSHLNVFAASSEFAPPSPGAFESLVSTSLPPMDEFSQNLSLARVSFTSDFSNGLDGILTVPAGQVMAKLSKQGSPGRDLRSNGLCPSLDVQDTGFLASAHQAKQQQQQIFNVYPDAAAAMSMQSGHQYPNGNVPASDMFASPVGLKIPSPVDAEMTSMLHTQQRLHFAARSQVQMEEERVQNRQLMQQQLVLRQQQLQEQQARFYASLQAHPGAMGSVHTRVPSLYQTDQHGTWNPALAINFYQEQHLQKQRLIGALTFDAGWKHQGPLAATASGLPEPAVLSQCANTCRYYAQGFCSRGETCPYLHVQTQNDMVLQPTVVVTNGMSPEMYPEKILSRKLPRGGLCVSPATSVYSVGKTKDVVANGYIHSNGNHLTSHNYSPVFHPDGKTATKSITHEFLDIELSESEIVQHHALQQQQLKYSMLEEVEGRIYTIAKDQHGCRFLQRKFEEGVIEDVQKIFLEIIDHIIELMTDPFGNYLVQKLLEVCNESQRLEIFQKVSGKGQLISVSLNMHGTRAVQKLIETLTSPEQVSMVISSLKQGVVTLIKDLNGNHVIQRCLQRLCNEDSQFIFDAAASHCVEIATHRHGCCVLQRCVDFASGAQRQHLVAEIASNALVLSQDPFGNYVVQYILDLAMPWATMDVIARLEGNFACLSMQKFSSNVVEKCLKLAGEENKADIIQELMNSSQLGQLLQDPYANYVVQRALTVSKGALHVSLIEAIKPHLPALRSSPYGKRILSRTNIKK